MSKTITVKGVGKVSASPDLVVLSMVLESQDLIYEKAMDDAARHIEQLNTALETVGFEKKSVKTTNFNVRTDYEYKRTRNGDNERVFNGYVVKHNLRRTCERRSEASEVQAREKRSCSVAVRER